MAFELVGRWSWRTSWNRCCWPCPVRDHRVWQCETRSRRLARRVGGVLHDLDRISDELLAQPEVLDLTVPPLTCPVTMLRGADTRNATPPDAADWGEHTTGPFQERLFPGSHCFVYDDAAAVVAMITDELRISSLSWKALTVGSSSLAGGQGSGEHRDFTGHYVLPGTAAPVLPA
ncbi:thioesterase II family protein [Streptomyces sp. NWU339]|uniref:thioesterase II family protein n=1 Tax=Streptomyces sp. NWU339 TaxID=2185284 RepID=UPI0011B63525|nr:hypothetical protein [Streptomyces sp. NWU339]